MEVELTVNMGDAMMHSTQQQAAEQYGDSGDVHLVLVECSSSAKIRVENS